MKELLKKWIYGGSLALAVLVVTSCIAMNSAKDHKALANAPVNTGTGSTTEVSPADPAIAPYTGRTISVSGEGEISVIPDVAYIQFGLSTNAATAKEAQSENAETFAQIKKVLTGTYKLNSKDVVTTNFSVQPMYTYANNEQPKITSYNAVQNVKVTYRDLDHIGVFLDDLSAAGVNQFSGIQFDTEQRQTYELQAIDSAMNNAKSKAEAIAANAKVQLQGVVNVSEQGVSSPVMPMQYGAQSMKAMAADSEASTSISTGELKISATVNVQYCF